MNMAEPKDKNLQIGNIRIDPPILLGPMAGVTDLPFRVLCKEQGAGLVCTEMISAKAILYKNKNTAALMKTDPSEHPVALQLFGSDPEIVAEAAAQIEDAPFEIFDFNMGCPVPKVVNNHEGSALMKEPRLAGEIIRALVDRVKKPVTVKIRRGFAEGEETAAEVAKVLEDAGASAITVHGRTREQFYSGEANWDCIRRVKEAVSIPVIGNGDVRSANDALRMIRETGCDGVMVARAARGNPWIFRELAEVFRNGTLEVRAPHTKEEENVVEGSVSGNAESARTIRPDERMQMIERHAQMLIAEKGEYIGVREMRKHIAWYTNGLPHAAALRREINEAEDWEKMHALLSQSICKSE